MSFPTISAVEIIQVISKIDVIRKAFFDPYTNAHRRLTALSVELASVKEAIDSRTKGNLDLRITNLIKQTLEECQHYLESHQEVLHNYQDLRLYEKFKKAGSTALTAFGHDLESYRERLSQHRIALIQADVERIGRQTSYLVDVAVAHEQNRTLAGQPGSELIERSSFLASSPKDIPTVPFSPASTTSPSSYGYNTSPALAPSLATSTKKPWQIVLENYPLPGISGPLPSRYIEGLALNTLKPVACAVEIEIGIGDRRDKIHASQYCINPPFCEWITDKDYLILRHRIQQSSIPRTQHRGVFGDPCLAQVDFLENQNLTFLPRTRGERNLSQRPRYCFKTETACRQFQGDFRSKDLLHTFHVKSVAIGEKDNSKKKKECVKIWKDRQGYQDVSISFPIPAQDEIRMRDYELSLRWFNMLQNSERIVTLNLIRAHPQHPVADKARKGSNTFGSIRRSFTIQNWQKNVTPGLSPTLLSVETLLPEERSDVERHSRTIDQIDIEFETVQQATDFYQKASSYASERRQSIGGSVPIRSATNITLSSSASQMASTTQSAFSTVPTAFSTPGTSPFAALGPPVHSDAASGMCLDSLPDGISPEDTRSDLSGAGISPLATTPGTLLAFGGSSFIGLPEASMPLPE